MFPSDCTEASSGRGAHLIAGLTKCKRGRYSSPCRHLDQRERPRLWRRTIPCRAWAWFFELSSDQVDGVCHWIERQRARATLGGHRLGDLIPFALLAHDGQRTVAIRTEGKVQTRIIDDSIDTIADRHERQQLAVPSAD